MQYYYLIKINMHTYSTFVQISVTLTDCLSNCPVVQLPAVNVRNIGPLCKHGHADAFSIRR